MRIGIVGFHGYGGSGILATELGICLAARGHDVHFITRGRPARLTAARDRLTWHCGRTPHFPALAYPPDDLALASLIGRVSKEQRLDVLHVHYAVPHATLAVLARDMMQSAGDDGPAIVITLHGTDVTQIGRDEVYLGPMVYGIDRSDAVTAVSGWLRDEAFRVLPGRRPIDVVTNFVDVDRFRPRPEHRSMPRLPARQAVISHVSNFRPVKRITDVVSIFARISARTSARLLLAGDGPDKPLAVERARALGVADRVHFLGEVPDVESVYLASDVFLLASEQESFSLSALEALACGVPVVATRTGGLPEVVRDGRTGLLFEVGDVADAASRVLSLLANLDTRVQMGRAARDDAAGRFTSRQIVDQYVTIYEKAIVNRSSPSGVGR
jgi:N-acetyl-alpha-D-glucosaminyl L-malate synthase BshA